MKTILLALFFTLSFYNFNKAYAAFPSSPPPVAGNESWQNLKAVDFVKLSAEEFSYLSGKKLTLKERISFSILKKGLKKEMKKNPNLKVSEYLAQKKRLGAVWIILISIAGAFLLLIAIFYISGANDIGRL